MLADVLRRISATSLASGSKSMKQPLLHRARIKAEDGPDEQTWVDVDQVTTILVHLLKTFAESGSFIDNDTKRRYVLPCLLRWELRKLQDEDRNYLEAKEELADRHGVSSRTLDRWMNPRLAKK